MGDMANYYNEYMDHEPDPAPVVCKHCGAKLLYWEQDCNDGRFFLVTNEGRVHLCNPLRAYRRKFG